MKILTIDTSTTANSVALTDKDRLLAEHLVNPDSTHSRTLFHGIAQVFEAAGLTLDEIDALGVTLGPGSFTGLRVGIAAVKGLSLASGKPVVGFSSLAMLAMNLPHASCTVCPMLDARKNEVYTALYRCGDLPRVVSQDCVTAPAEFLQRLNQPTLFVGSGALRYRELITDMLGDLALFAPSVCHTPRASAGAVLATDLFARGELIPAAELLPVYIRPSEAELARLQKDSAG